MLDTIALQYLISIRKEILSAYWGFEREQIKRHFRSRWMLDVTTEHGCVITYKYFPYTITGIPFIQVEFSPTHLVFGDNVYIPYNLEELIDQANTQLPHVIGIPELDLWNGKLSRWDIPYNFQVGNLAPFYVQAVQCLEFTRRKPRPYSNQGFQWGNRQWSLKMYNKELWYIDNKLPINPEAKGILRLELTLRKNKVKSLTGKNNPTLHNITLEMAMDALEGELRGLGLLNRSIGTYDTTLAKLCNVYGIDAGFCYFGALAARVEYPNRDTIISTSGIHPRALDRRLKKVLAAGLPLTMTKTEEPLPPLTIDRNNVIEIERSGASVMKCQVIH